MCKSLLIILVACRVVSGKPNGIESSILMLLEVWNTLKVRHKKNKEIYHNIN